MNNILKHQLVQLFKANLLEILREPGVLFWGIVFPILMSLGLGLAFTEKADILRKAVYIESEQSNPTDSSGVAFFLNKYAVVDENAAPESFNYKIEIPDDKLGNSIFMLKKSDWNQALVLLKRGSINIILTDSAGKINYHFDPANPDAQLSYLKLSSLQRGEIDITKTTNLDVIPMTLRGTRYIDFLIPGLIAMGIMMSCMWGISYGIIEKRSKKLLRRLVATPMSKSYFLMAMMSVRVLMNFIESALLFVFAYFAFGIRIEGSIPALFIIFIAGNMAFTGLAVFISARTAKTEVGNGLINAVVMPMMVLSGIFFSYHNFPDWAIPYLQKFPLTVMADDMRSIFIEGAGFAEVALNSAVMAATGIVFFIAGMQLFKWH